jgi:hypothetical protein
MEHVLLDVTRVCKKLQDARIPRYRGLICAPSHTQEDEARSTERRAAPYPIGRSSLGLSRNYYAQILAVPRILLQANDVRLLSLVPIRLPLERVTSQRGLHNRKTSMPSKG